MHAVGSAEDFVAMERNIGIVQYSAKSLVDDLQDTRKIFSTNATDTCYGCTLLHGVPFMVLFILCTMKRVKQWP